MVQVESRRNSEMKMVRSSLSQGTSTRRTPRKVKSRGEITPGLNLEVLMNIKRAITIFKRKSSQKR